MSTECSTRRKPNAVFQGMARHPNIVAFIFAVIVSIIINYGDSFSSSKPVEVPAKQPTFWFSPYQSFVLDSPRGALLPIVNRLKQNELVFVMFYAPWCARSLEAKVEFEKAAAILHGKVTFAAVNCWWPEGECSKQYKFLMYPSFLAYHTNLDGFKFIGVARADYMVKFVESLVHPLSLVTSKEQVQNLIARHDFVVFGFFDLMSQAQIGSYRQFYYASMRILEKDPLQPIHFAVISDKNVAQAVHLKYHVDIIMAGIGKNTVIYPYKNNVTSTNLVNWAVRNKGMPVVKRLSLLGVKSRFVADEIKKGPALILFHQENTLFRAEPGMSVMKEVALLFKACNLSDQYKGLHLKWKGIAHDDIQFYRKVVERCRTIRKIQHLLREFPCCMSVLMESPKRNVRICDVCKTSKHQHCRMFPSHVLTALSHTSPCQDCQTTVPTYTHPVDYSLCCHNSTQYEFDVTKWVSYHRQFDSNTKFIPDVITTGRDVDDIAKRHPTNRYHIDHLENLPRKLCSQLSIQKQENKVLEGEKVDSILMKRFSELSCVFNRTLNFYSIDSKTSWMFTQRLGLLSESMSSSPGVVLFDKDNEEHYIMKENVTVSNTMSFILAFQHGHLQRHRNSHSFDASHCNDKPGSICVKELDSNNFLDTVKDENKDVVVLIYAHWCGFCQTFSHTFLAVARYFSTSKYIIFTRINGDTNDLPWEYTVDAFPTILFFPARRKADSIMFPSHKEKTFTNLIRFILRHTTFDTRLLLAADVCSKSCIHSNRHRSQALLKELRERYTLCHVRLKEMQRLIMGEQGKDYLKMLYEFLVKHLYKLRQRINNVEKLIEYLEKNEDRGIDKKELVELLSI